MVGLDPSSRNFLKQVAYHHASNLVRKEVAKQCSWPPCATVLVALSARYQSDRIYEARFYSEEPRPAKVGEKWDPCAICSREY